MDWLEKSKKNKQKTKKNEGRRSYDPKSSGMDPELMDLGRSAEIKGSVKEPQKIVALNKIHKVPEKMGKEEKKERTLVLDESKQEVKKELSLKERLSIYNDKEKERRVQLLIEKKIPVPQDRDELISMRAEYMEYVYLVNTKGDYLLNSEGKRRLDQAWKPDADPLIVENYEWLMQYFTAHDTSIDQNRENDKAIPAIEFKDHEASMDMPGMKEAYERQGTSNCYACAGTAMINQFIAMRKNEENITRRVGQYDMRAYRPMIRKYDPATENVMDKDEYAGNVANVDFYAGAGKTETGNIFALGDFMLDTLEKNGISDVMLNRMVFRDPKIDKQKGDNEHDKSVHNNMQAVFADKIAEILRSGAIAGVLIQEPGYSHYVTVTGIKGDELTVYDSAMYKGKADKLKINSFIQRGRTVEINWLSDMKKPEEMTKEYQNLQYDPQTGYSLKKVSHTELGESATHTKGITVLKEGVEMGEAYEQIAQFSYIPDPLAHVETQTVEEAVGEIGEKQETVTEEIKEEKKEAVSEDVKEEKKEAVPEEIKEEKKEAVPEEVKEEKYSGKKLSSSKRKKVSLDSGLEKIEEVLNEETWEREEEKHQKKLREGRERYEKLKIQQREAKEQEAEMHQKLQEYNAKKEEERKKREAKIAQEVQVRSVIEGDFSKSKKSVRKEAVKTQKAFEKAYKDYQTFGLGSDLRNTDIVAGDRRYMRGVKNALANYLNIRDALFEKYGYAEMKAEDIGAMNMHTYEGAEARKKAFKQNKSAVNYNVSDQDTMENDWRMRNLTEDETKKLADAYEIVNEAAKDYLEHHGSIFKFGRGRSRVKQVRRLRDRLQLDNIRFGLSSERRKIKASLDKKYSKEVQNLRRELHPTWHKCVLFNDVIDTREIGHREKRRRQRAEGKVPAWYKRVWSWTKRGFKNSGCRLLMAYNGLGGLIDRGIGLATAVAANTISLAGKTVKLPLKAMSCIFNGISSLKGSKKRWDVSIDPRKDWKSIDDGRKIFRRYLKGACILPMAVVETFVRGLPSLFGHYFKSGVYKRTGRWAKAIYGDVKRVAEGVGIKDYRIADRAVEDTEMAGYITADNVNAPNVMKGGVAKTYHFEEVGEDEEEYEDPEMMQVEEERESLSEEERKSIHDEERKSIHDEERKSIHDEEIKDWGGYKFGASTFKKRKIISRKMEDDPVTLEEIKAALGPDVMAEKAKAYRDRCFGSDHVKKYVTKAPEEKDLNELIESSYSKLHDGKKTKSGKRAAMLSETRKKLAMQAHLLNEYRVLQQQREEERQLLYDNLNGKDIKGIEKRFKTPEEKETISLWLMGEYEVTKAYVFFASSISSSQADMLSYVDNTDITEFKYESDEEFISHFAEKYEKLCKLSSAGFYFKDLDSKYHSVAKLRAVSEMASALKTEYEDRARLISSPYHAAFDEKDLRPYLGKDGEQKIAAVKDKELAEYLKLYRKVEKNRIGKSKGYKAFQEEKIAKSRKEQSRVDAEKTRSYIQKVKDGQKYAKKIKKNDEDPYGENGPMDTEGKLMLVYRQQLQLEASKEEKDDVKYVKETRPGEDYTNVFGLIQEKEIYDYEKTVASFAENGEIYGVKIDEKHKPEFMKLFNEWVGVRREWLRSKKAYELCGVLAAAAKCDMKNPAFLKTKEASWLLGYKDDNGAPNDQFNDYRQLKAKYLTSFLKMFEYLHKNGYPMSEKRKYEKRLETKETIQEAIDDELSTRQNQDREARFATVTVNGKTFTSYAPGGIIDTMAKQAQNYTFEGEEGDTIADLLSRVEEAEKKRMVIDRTYGGQGKEKYVIHYVYLKELHEEHEALKKSLLPLLDGKVEGLEKFMPEDMKKNRKKAAAEKKEEKKEEIKAEKKEEKKEEIKADKKEENRIEEAIHNVGKKYEKKDKPYGPKEMSYSMGVTMDVISELKWIDSMYKKSGIPEEDLKVLKDNMRATIEYRGKMGNALPEKLLKEGTDPRKEIPGTDSRDYHVLYRQVKLDDNGQPVTEEDKKNLELNIRDHEGYKTCKLSERRNHLDYVALEAMELFFDSKQITDYDYIRSHKEKAVRHLSFFHTLMNRYMSHKEYYLKQAPPAIRVFMFLIMGGTQYAEICAPKINYALYGYGYGNGALGGSSAQTVYPGYEPGVDYNKMKAANEKVSRLKSARALTDYYVEFSDCKIMQIDPYSEKGLKKNFGAIDDTTGYSSFTKEQQYLIAHEFGPKTRRDKMKNADVYDMTFKYLEEFMKKKDDKAYIDKMLKIIDGYLDKNKVTNDEGIINDLDKVKSKQ